MVVLLFRINLWTMLSLAAYANLTQSPAGHLATALSAFKATQVREKQECSTKVCANTKYASVAPNGCSKQVEVYFEQIHSVPSWMFDTNGSSPWSTASCLVLRLHSQPSLTLVSLSEVLCAITECRSSKPVCYSSSVALYAQWTAKCHCL